MNNILSDDNNIYKKTDGPSLPCCGTLSLAINLTEYYSPTEKIVPRKLYTKDPSYFEGFPENTLTDMFSILTEKKILVLEKKDEKDILSSEYLFNKEGYKLIVQKSLEESVQEELACSLMEEELRKTDKELSDSELHLLYMEKVIEAKKKTDKKK